jgi:hypothetical protein
MVLRSRGADPWRESSLKTATTHLPSEIRQPTATADPAGQYGVGWWKGGRGSGIDNGGAKPRQRGFANTDPPVLIASESQPATLASFPVKGRRPIRDSTLCCPYSSPTYQRLVFLRWKHKQQTLGICSTWIHSKDSASCALSSPTPARSLITPRSHWLSAASLTCILPG